MIIKGIEPPAGAKCEFCDSRANYVGAADYQAIYTCSSCNHTFHAPFLPNELRKQLKNSTIHVEPVKGMDRVKADEIKADWRDGQEFRVLNGKKAIKKISKFNAPHPCILIFHYYDGRRVCKLRIGAKRGINSDFSDS